MKGLVAFFSALLKGKKGAFSDLLHKVAHSKFFCQHPETQKHLRRKSKSKRKKAEKATLSSVNTDSPLTTPSDFEFLTVIGSGTFGKVLLARHRKQGGYYAVKVLQKQMIIKRKEQKHVMVERSVLLKGLQNPFLVGLHFSFQTPNALYFVLDYVNGGELFYHLQREGSFPEPRAAFYTAEMAAALGYLHSLQIVYRDLKPENILLDSEGHVMLTDFGLCKEGVAVGEIMNNTFCGTPQYLAPEVLQGQPYTPAVDWWGLGVVLFEMLSGMPPFYSQRKVEMFENILHAPLQLPNGASRAAQSLLAGLLDREVSSRLGEKRDFEEIQEHHFFASINWDDLLARKVRPPFVPNVTGPGDVSYIDPEFTLQPVPASVNDRCQAACASDAFPGFSFINSEECVATNSLL
ncbi:Serine/threonine-protein kinase Sgk1 [Oryzias melastigma]|uniref:Serine/threonine-protein kinase sgk-1 n=1 Tax=Oryzias melastigma TaxID=30732 RepID=A0A834FSB6_ORYME|nr:serine/threonine-protein kinase Sgk2b [Oryzias melastigma]KAF6739583.1 Serine/threonine-protein kinase Sgk1 [Oryzias melastigma]